MAKLTCEEYLRVIKDTLRYTDVGFTTHYDHEHKLSMHSAREVCSILGVLDEHKEGIGVRFEEVKVEGEVKSRLVVFDYAMLTQELADASDNEDILVVVIKDLERHLALLISDEIMSTAPLNNYCNAVAKLYSGYNPQKDEEDEEEEDEEEESPREKLYWAVVNEVISRITLKAVASWAAGKLE